MRRLVLLALAGGCSTDDLGFSPVFETPPSDDTSAYPYNSVIDELVLAVANEGETADAVANTFARGQTISLPGIPFGDDLVVHATGLNGGNPAAYGRSCAFTLSPDAPAPSPHLWFSQSNKFGTTSIAPLPRSGGRAFPFLGGAVFLGGTTFGAGAGVQDVEQFDPRTGELTTATNKINARANVTAALIGATAQRVLLVGGTSDGSAASFIELYDPVSGGEKVNTTLMSRVGLTSTTLAGGTVVVVGGSAPGTGQPAVGTVTVVSLESTGPEIRNVAVLQHPRTGHTATALGDNVGASVLIAGGTEALDAGNTVYAAELYKPLPHSLSSSFSAEMRHPRTHHRAVRLSDGSVLFIGGVDATHQPVRELERFTLEEGFVDVVIDENAMTPVVVKLPDEIGVIDMTVTVLPDNRVPVVGGKADESGAGLATAVVLRLDPDSGTVDVLVADPLAYARADHQATLLCDGTVLITGGSSNQIPAERYNPPASGRR